MRSILVLVHPGSACGSADFNLGPFEGERARDILAQDLADWEGGVIVIDGALSDEVPGYPSLADALDEALAQARPALRILGDDASDYDQRRAVLDAATQIGATPETVRFTVTGAWFDPEEASGCVNSVRDALGMAGFVVEVRPSAVPQPPAD